MILNSNETKEKILNEFLKICPFEGWTRKSVAEAIKNCDLSITNSLENKEKIDEKFIDIIFENGVLELAEFYIESQNNKMVSEIEKIENFSSQKIRDKIRSAVYLRFEIENDNRVTLQRLVNFYLSPKNFVSVEMGTRPIGQAMRACYKISDSIWKAIGDQSTDFNFYTKRLTLSKIILRSLMVFLRDDSENLEKTYSFIDQQIESVMKFEKRKHALKSSIGKVSDVFHDLFSDDKYSLKSPQKILKNLPFIRLIKF